jgi:hypothetical protein
MQENNMKVITFDLKVKTYNLSDRLEAEILHDYKFIMVENK